jgi:hypothetical protein
VAHLIFKNGNAHRGFFAALAFDDGEIRVFASAVKAFNLRTPLTMSRNWLTDSVRASSLIALLK